MKRVSKTTSRPLLADAVALFRQLANWYSIGPQAVVALSPGHRFIDSRMARRTVTLHRRDGTRLRCQVRECAAYYSCFIRRDYDTHAVSWPSAQVVVDVGANIGASTLWLALKSTHAQKILALEPNPMTCAQLRENVASNPRLGRVHVMEAAFSDKDGAAGFEPAGFSIQSHLASGGASLVSTVSLRRLLVFAGGSIDVMKLDCEGSEFALLSCRNELDMVGAIVGEYHSSLGDWAELRRHLTARGFRVDDDGHRLFKAVRQQ